MKFPPSKNLGCSSKSNRCDRTPILGGVVLLMTVHYLWKYESLLWIPHSCQIPSVPLESDKSFATLQSKYHLRGNPTRLQDEVEVVQAHLARNVKSFVQRKTDDSLYYNTYIYMYVCVCVCVCLCMAIVL